MSTQFAACTFAIVCVFTTSGCEGGSASHAQIDVGADGLVRVTNTGASVWTAETAWQLEEDLRLGSVDGGGPEQFSRIAAILSDSRGMIYVLDLQSQEVRVFNPSGAFSHTIGGLGEGPGEHLGANRLAFGPGDTLWVIDPHMGNRYSAFGPDGAFVRSHMRQVQAGPLAGGFTPDGRYVDWGTAFPDEGPNVIAGSRLVHHPVRLSADFQPADSLPPIEFAQEMITLGDGRSVPRVYFGERLEAYQDATGQIWFAHSRDYRIVRRTLEGDTTLVFSLPAEPAPVGEPAREELRARFLDRPDLLNVYAANLPATKPVIQRVFGDEAGHIYVVPELAGVPAGTVLDVFRGTGEYLGRLNLPAPISSYGIGSLAPTHATRDHLYYVVADDLDVPYLIRLRIDRPD